MNKSNVEKILALAEDPSPGALLELTAYSKTIVPKLCHIILLMCALIEKFDEYAKAAYTAWDAIAFEKCAAELRHALEDTELEGADTEKIE